MRERRVNKAIAGKREFCDYQIKVEKCKSDIAHKANEENKLDIARNELYASVGPTN